MKSKRTDKPLTVDDLARMVQKHMVTKDELAASEKRINARFDKIETLFARVELKLDTVLDSFYDEFDGLAKSVKKLEQAVFKG